MKTWLLRHAHALPEEENPLRPLSREGRETCQRLVEFFRRNGALSTATTVWHSPLVRARETAELLRSGLLPEAMLVETGGLLSEDDPLPVADRLEQQEGSVVMVGHEPQLSALATLLVRGKDRPAAFELKKGAIIELEMTGGRHKKTGRRRWRVRWYFVPELLGPAEA
ncbi:MAG: histidine phosphatase family protein [Opitutaceae bacterium]|nr:histidine phosphatase family protein [Opitutaceae bacterium]